MVMVHIYKKVGVSACTVAKRTGISLKCYCFLTMLMMLVHQLGTVLHLYKDIYRINLRLFMVLLLHIQHVQGS